MTISRDAALLAKDEARTHQDTPAAKTVPHSDAERGRQTGFSGDELHGGVGDRGKGLSLTTPTLIEIEESWNADPAGEDGWGEMAEPSWRYDGVPLHSGIGRAGRSDAKGDDVRDWAGGVVGGVQTDLERGGKGMHEGRGEEGELPVVGDGSIRGRSAQKWRVLSNGGTSPLDSPQRV